MQKRLKTISTAIAAFFKWESSDPELLQSISTKVMGTTLGTYIVWHILATLVWPQYFSPSIYMVTLEVILTAALTYTLIRRIYLLGQVVWFVGLITAILTGYTLYGKPEILLLLCFLPIMAEVTLGIRPAIVVEGIVCIIVLGWDALPFTRTLPLNYDWVLILSSAAATALGWGISDNLVTSIDAASYHYREAVQRLNEAREHRAEISVLLKDVNKANYQLDRLNRMLIFSRAQAEEAREERNRFAMAVSHELRSPLNFIIGFSDLMVNSPDTYAKVTNWPRGLYDDIREIYKSSTHLLSLINDILDMGKMDAQQMMLFKERIDFALIFEDVRQMVHSAVESKGLELKIELQPDLPLVYVDRTRIRQVLLNLVTNSLRFTRKGSITLKGYLSNPETLRVDVIDTGVGIAKADQSKVFKEFRQVGNQNWQREEGSGLGLSIGRRFIEMHGGEMGLESELGKGSTFYFTLPLKEQVEVLDEANAGTEPMVTTGGVDEKSPLLLLLAPDAFSARAFAELIHDCKVTLMTNPAQLYQTVATTYPRAVMIDETMILNNDVQAFLNDPPYDCPVITFPIPLSRQNRTSNLPEGVCDYLVKPVPRQVLVETIAGLHISPQTVLVVDDDPSMARFVSQSLRVTDDEKELLAEDLKILTALDGQEALRYLQAVPVGVVLLDLDLTDMNGLTLLNQIRLDSELSKIPVVIISASDPPPTFDPQNRGSYQVIVNRNLNRKELADLLNSTLRQVFPIFREHAAEVNETEGIAENANDQSGEMN